MINVNSTALPDQMARTSILQDLDKTMLVEAAAGTGKTTCMVGRMVGLLAAGKCRIHTLAAVTFTRKAAAELRGRFALELKRCAASAQGEEMNRLNDALQHVEQCFIGTIHSFCGRLLRERPVEAGVDLEFQEMEEEVDVNLRHQAWERMAAHLYAEGDPDLDILEELGLTLSDLKHAFETYALYPDVQEWPTGEVPLPVITDVVGRIREYAAHIEEIVLKNTGDMGNDDLIPRYRRILRHLRQVDLNKVPDVMELLEEFKPTSIVQNKWHNKDVAKEEKERIKEFAEKVAAPLLCQWREYRYAAVMRLLKRAAGEYQQLKEESGLLNFQDLLLLAARLLRDKPNIRTYFRSRFTHLLVDEFQDTDPIQAEVMLLLTASDIHETNWRKSRPVPGSLFVVGDPKQSIYRFRRADIETYNEVRRIIQETKGEVVNLSANFRTVPNILAWVNGVFSDKFAAPDDPYSPAYVNLEPGRTECSVPDSPPLTVLQIPGDLKTNDVIIAWEADQIAAMIDSGIRSERFIPRSEKELAAGVSPKARPSDFLIVTRGRKHLSQYAAALRARGIPHEVTGGTGLNETHDLALLTDCLVAVSRPDDPIALLTVLRGELFGFSDVELYKFIKAGGEFRLHSRVPQGLDMETQAAFEDAYSRLQQYGRWIHTLLVMAAVERILDDLGLMALAASRLGGIEQAGALAKAVELLRSRESLLWSFSSLVEVLQSLVSAEEKQDSISIRPDITDVVRIMNLHKVKGLEAPVVFLADPSGNSDHAVNLHVTRSGDRVQGYLAVGAAPNDFGKSQTIAQPVEWASHEEEERRFLEAEEIRLLYVAATRVGVQLVVTLRSNREGDNPWVFFKKPLADFLRLQEWVIPGVAQTADYSVAPEDWKNAVDGITQRWRTCAAATYETRAAKQLSRSDHPITSLHGGLGPDWGEVIHALLEMALRNPGADFYSAAQSQLEEYQLDRTLASLAVDIVKSVCASDIWRRAQSSQRCLPEVPFHLFDEKGAEGGRPLILHGQIDLVFEEADGWVIVDYKTDRAAECDLPALVEYYRPQLENYAHAWGQATGAKIKECGLFFTTPGKYMKVIMG